MVLAINLASKKLSGCKKGDAFGNSGFCRGLTRFRLPRGLARFGEVRRGLARFDEVWRGLARFVDNGRGFSMLGEV